jgi:glycerophosphoryl diester phosphodiesterase
MIKKHIAIICCSIGVTFVALTIPSILIYSKNIGTAHLIAHRGYSSKYYENTKTAFEEAGKSDAFWGIETDLFKTKDGEFVCSHNVDPFGKSKPRIIDLTYEELSEYSIDYSQNYYHLAPPPGEEKGLASFEEYLNICNTYKKVPIIELKQESFFKEDIYSILDKVGNI